MFERVFFFWTLSRLAKASRWMEALLTDPHPNGGANCFALIGLCGQIHGRASSTQVANVISVQPCARALTNVNDTDKNLRRLALGGKALKNLRSCVYEFEI